MSFYLTAILQGLCFSGLALGVYLSMKIFNIPDITTDGSYTLGGALTGVVLSHGLPPLLALPLILLAGAAAGAVTGIIHTRMKVNPLLAGILVMSALYSVNLTIMGRSNIPLLNAHHLFNEGTLPEGVRVSVLFSSALLTAIALLLKTDFGIAMRATGNSESMIRALGVNTGRMKVTGLAIANALTASSGYLMAQYQGFADINMGLGIVITGLGAVVIGETLILQFRIRSIPGVLLLMIAGAVVFQLALSVALSLGIDPALLKLVTAAAVLALIGLARVPFKRFA
jgi:putative ABC transport system permease protein